MRVETLKEVRERESTVAISTAPVTIIIQHLLEQSSSNCAKLGWIEYIPLSPQKLSHVRTFFFF